MDLTLHNLPAHVLEDLQRAARLNGRSVNDEAIARLRGRDSHAGSSELSEAGVAALLAEIREARRSSPARLTPELLDLLKREGRL